jgi:tetratricopeptide (TPR) repeat protein
MKRIFFYLLVITLSLGVAYDILSEWRGVYLLQSQPSEKVFLRALRFTPLNPGSFYGLSLFHQWDLQHVDLKKSFDYLGKAIERNPLEQAYWITLAKVNQRSGEKEAMERALENAILVYPTGFQGRWAVGTLLLQEGTLEKALPHFIYLLRHYPEQSSLVYDVWLKVVDDPDFLLEKLVPNELSSLKDYLSYLYENKDSESAKKVWRKMMSLGLKADRIETLRHIDFLISSNEWNEAKEVWEARLQEEGMSLQSDGNVIVNGGFEKEKILGGGFDWKIADVPGAKVSFDRSVAFEGKGSLKITFDGKENVDFHHIYQIVPLKPSRDYLLRAYMKTIGVTTKSGLKLEAYGIGSTFYGSSETLIGDNEWKELSISFRTTALSQAGVVRVRREKTNKFDRLISGTVWIDNVQLSER